MSLTFEVSDGMRDAAEEWAERRMVDSGEALETKIEQALLEIEHLVAGVHEVSFEVRDGTVVYEPTADLETFLARQAAETGLDESTLLKAHVDLFAPAFLAEATDEDRPPNAPPPD